jgi:hypothetical protein
MADRFEYAVEVLFAYSPTLAPAAPAVFAMGITNAVLNASFPALMQLSVPTEMRGRTLATFSTGIQSDDAGLARSDRCARHGRRAGRHPHGRGRRPHDCRRGQLRDVPAPGSPVGSPASASQRFTG